MSGLRSRRRAEREIRHAVGAALCAFLVFTSIAAWSAHSGQGDLISPAPAVVSASGADPTWTQTDWKGGRDPGELLPGEYTIGLWHFDEGAGSKVRDSTANGNDGTIGGTENTNWRWWVDNGRFDSALYVMDSTGKVTVPNSSSLNPSGGFDNLTVEFWYYDQDVSAANEIVGKFDWEENGWLVKDDGQATDSAKFKLYVWMGFGPGNGAYGWVIDNAGRAGEWVHIATVYAPYGSGHKMTVYANGVEIGSASYYAWGSIARANNSLVMGNGKGVIDEVRIENRALTAEEIAADAAWVRSGTWSDTYCRYNQGENVGTYLSPSRVTIESYGDGGHQLLVDNSPFLIRGFNYAPTPVGRDPRIPSQVWCFDENTYKDDLPVLENMGANTLLIHEGEYVTKKFMDAAYEHGLRVILTYNVRVDENLADNRVQENHVRQFVRMVNTWKGHPAVLMWCFGSELDSFYQGSLNDFYNLLNDAAGAAHAAEGENYHPVMTKVAWMSGTTNCSIGDASKGADDASLPNLDVWGVDAYLGPTFGNLFENLAARTNKPLVMAEFGCDALDARDNTVNQAMQASYLENQWREIYEHCGRDNNTSGRWLGGTVFEWSDEWWKSYTLTSDRPEQHDNTAGWYWENYYDYVSGKNNMNEEWWGVVGIRENTYTREYRKAFTTLKGLWTALAGENLYENERWDADEAMTLKRGVYRRAPVTENTQALWRMDEGEGSWVYDETGRNVGIVDPYTVYSDDAVFKPGANPAYWGDVGSRPTIDNTSETPPEGSRYISVYKNSTANGYGGWGVYHRSAVDLSSYSGGYLKFWIKTPQNLLVGVSDTTADRTVSISDYGWDGTNTWQRLSIPINDLGANLSAIDYTFLTKTDGTTGTFTYHVDHVVWVPPASVGSSARTASGKFGSALKFDNNDSIEFSTSASLNPENFTVEAWVYLNSYPTGSGGDLRKTIIAKGGEDNVGYYGMFINSDNTLSAKVHTENAPYEVKGATRLELNRWYHVAMTFDGRWLKLFLDGRLDGCRRVDLPKPSNTMPLRIGSVLNSTYIVYGEQGFVYPSAILTWSAYSNGAYQEVTNQSPPEGSRCFQTLGYSDWPGWGVFLGEFTSTNQLIQKHTVDLSGYDYLEFWIKSNCKIKVEVQDIENNKSSVSVNSTGGAWSFQSIPRSSFTGVDATKIYGVVLFTEDDTITTGQQFWIDWVRWVDTDENNYFDGRIDEVRIENRALSDEEVEARAGYVPSAYVESSVFDAGESVDWGTITWTASTPSGTVGDNYPASVEPSTLADGTGRVGTATEGSLLNVKTQNTVYENIGEELSVPWPSSENIILFWDGDTIPDGWVCISDVGGDFYNRFPRGSATYGGTGGSETHSHNITLDSMTGATYSNCPGTANVAAANHIHSLSSFSVSTENHLPPYKTLKVIRYNGGAQEIPAGAIAIFDKTPPSGWSLYNLKENYVRGGADNSTGGSATHKHTVTINLAADAATAQGATTNTGTDAAASDHTHSGENSSSENTNAPPYIDVILAKADSATYIPNGMIAMFDTTPGADWTVLSGSGGDFENKFIRGTSAYGATGGRTKDNHSNLTITTGGPTTTRARTSGAQKNVATGTHIHDVTLRFTENEILPPYINVIFAKGSGKYALNWEHRITGIDNTFENYKVRVYGYRKGSETIGVYIRNVNTSSWELMGNLQADTPGWIEYHLTSENVNNYLQGGENICIRYFENTPDATQDNIYIDYCAVEATSYATTSITVKTRTGTDNNPRDGGWNDWAQQTSGSAITSPDNRYIQYRIELSTTDPTLTPTFYEITMSYTTGGVAGISITPDGYDFGLSSLGDNISTTGGYFTVKNTGTTTEDFTIRGGNAEDGHGHTWTLDDAPGPDRYTLMYCVDNGQNVWVTVTSVAQVFAKDVEPGENVRIDLRVLTPTSSTEITYPYSFSVIFGAS